MKGIRIPYSPVCLLVSFPGGSEEKGWWWRIRSHCLLRVSLCHPSLLFGTIPFRLLQSFTPRGDPHAKPFQRTNLGRFFSWFLPIKFGAVHRRSAWGEKNIYFACVSVGTALSSCKQILLESIMEALRKKQNELVFSSRFLLFILVPKLTWNMFLLLYSRFSDNAV